MNGIVQKLRKVKVDSWLGACAAVLVVVLMIQGVGYARVRAMGSEFEEALLAHSAQPTREESRKVEDYEPIMGKGIFGKKRPPPAPKLFGLLDGSALMGGDPNKARLYELDADLPGGFKLVEISFNSVVVEREDKRETISLFPGLTDKVDAPRRPPRGRGPRRAEPAARPAEAAQAEEPPQEGGAAPPAESEYMTGGKMDWQKIGQEMEGLSDEERLQKWQDILQKLPAEQREQAQGAARKWMASQGA